MVGEGHYWTLPGEAEGFLNEEVLAALRAIRPPEQAKKRATVLLLAFAVANDQAWARVFEDKRTCNQRIWYQKWQYLAEVAQALEVCTARALEWRDVETAQVETHATQERRRAIARASLSAVRGLEMTALSREDRADYRTEAAMRLLALADPDLAARVQTGKGALEVQITNLDELIEHEVQRVAGVVEGGDESGDESDGRGGAVPAASTEL